MNKYSFKIIYHIGNSINIKTKVKTGKLTINQKTIQITDSKTQEKILIKVKKAELTKMSLGGHIIKITDTQEKIIFISVVRLSIKGQFAIINYFKTKKLFRMLTEK